MRFLISIGFLCISQSAVAQSPGDFTLHGAAVLAPQGSGFMSDSVGRPAVVWDSNNNLYRMIFEARTPDTDPDCPAGIWELGIADSNDGITWTPKPNPLFEADPTSSTYFNCVAAHPTALFRKFGSNGNGSIEVYFKAEQSDDNCDSTTQAWGCEQYTGIGRVTVKLNASGGIASINISNSPVLAVSTNMGYPSIIRNDQTLSMALTQYPDVYMATGTTWGGFSIDGVVLEAADYNSLSWVEEELYSPSMLCEERSVPSDPAYKMYVGGRDNNSSFVVQEAGWSSAISTAAGSGWSLNTTPFFTWSNDDEFRHIDGVRIDETSSTEYLAYYSERSGGDNSIYLAYTDAGWTPANTYGKNCNN